MEELDQELGELSGFFGGFGPASGNSNRLQSGAHVILIGLNLLTCSITRLVIEQVLRFFGLKPCKTAFLSGCCSETEVSEQLFSLLALILASTKEEKKL
jgi:hypothetical protein